MAIRLIFLLAISLGSLNQTAWSQTEEAWFSSFVTISDNDVATLTADVMLAAPPETVYAVLSDYPNWPDLFAQPPTINTIQRNNNHVRVSMTFKVSFLPIGLRLATDTEEIPTTLLKTTLIEGDFEQYEWIWTFRPLQDPQHTKASVVVHVQPSVWIPHWLLEWVLTSSFTEHLHKLREAVQVRYREQGATTITSAPPNTP
ncbi:SRPBCC family protein [Candidatus Nitronereus thalassa]|uniref:SRPBCC family protein n=1 Tax=Candidatus Nitronereus thalassa TaxID=3020898 RepID=A0ABU3KC79_9BACT|nr:SRPBCC family protein [Candidatus Nitronereus thalassa]MDT7044025.1 SRPBCC family protein [Candidatus Nitronereus thalassa]